MKEGSEIEKIESIKKNRKDYHPSVNDMKKVTAFQKYK